MKIRQWCFVTFLICIGCQKEINLDLSSNPHKLVIEGMVTNGPGPYHIVLKTTTSFSASDTLNTGSPVTHAMLEITDNLGNTFPLQEGDPGNYWTDSTNFRGVLGRSYSIKITTADGKHYVSKPELMVDVPSIDSIYYTSMLLQGLEGGTDHGYQIFIDYSDPPENRNYYRWKTLSDGNISPGANIESDEFFNGKKRKHKDVGGSAPLRNRDSASVQVQQLSLSLEAYRFWVNFQNESEPSDNAPYDTPPAPLTGNVYNPDDPSDYVLGYFQVSGVSIAEVTIKK